MSLDHPPSIIQETRDIIHNMTKEQRFKKAKRHLFDAINNRNPRNDY